MQAAERDLMQPTVRHDDELIGVVLVENVPDGSDEDVVERPHAVRRGDQQRVAVTLHEGTAERESAPLRVQGIELRVEHGARADDAGRGSRITRGDEHDEVVPGEVVGQHGDARPGRRGTYAMTVVLGAAIVRMTRRGVQPAQCKVTFQLSSSALQARIEPPVRLLLHRVVGRAEVGAPLRDHRIGLVGRSLPPFAERTGHEVAQRTCLRQVGDPARRADRAGFIPSDEQVHQRVVRRRVVMAKRGCQLGARQRRAQPFRDPHRLAQQPFRAVVVAGLACAAATTEQIGVAQSGQLQRVDQLPRGGQRHLRSNSVRRVVGLSQRRPGKLDEPATAPEFVDGPTGEQHRFLDPVAQCGSVGLREGDVGLRLAVPDLEEELLGLGQPRLHSIEVADR